MSADRSDVSVVIATKDRSAFLRQALTSALGREGVDVEVLVVDDGSTDETPSVLKALACERVSVVRNERSRHVLLAQRGEPDGARAVGRVS